MLRKIRIIFAAIFFIGVTLLFLDFTGALHAWLGWMAKIQLLPAVLSMNLAVIAGLIILTLLFGRVYCSVICPLGIMQDIFSWIRGMLKKKYKFRFSYSPAKNWLRHTLLVLFAAGLALGAHAVVLLIAPYSAYGRIAANLLAPIYQLGNNLLAWIAERADSYAFYSTDVWIRSASTFAVATITLVTIGVLSWRNGRTWCNTICPVGTVLGFLAKFSLFAPVIDAKKCRDCGLCERRCKASCINMKEHEIDLSRCVACMDCIDTCKEGAIHYSRRKFNRSAKDNLSNSPDQGRRAFLISGSIATTAIAAKAQEMKVDGGLAAISLHQKPERQTPLVPAGSLSLRNFTDHCIACQLCVTSCPNHVLRPSTDLATLMQPEMSYERGYCRPECTTCSEVCPAGAIRPISIEEKSSIQIGHAVVNLDACVVNKDNVRCGNCARHCPAGAISMVKKNPEDENSLRIPTVNEERCIGCGACENLCPARPLAAIHVEGHEVHREL